MNRTLVNAALLVMASVIVLGGAAFAEPGGGRESGFDGPPPGRGFGPEGGPPRPPHGTRPPSPRDLERAGVTEAQRAKIAGLHDDFMRRTIRLIADLRIAELDLHKVIESDDPDRSAVDAAIDRVGELRTRLHKAHVGELLAVRALLTPAQRAKLERSRAAPERN